MLINNAVITGSLTVNGTDVTYITGSSQISSSFLALSSSYLITSASYVVTSGSYAITSASFAQTSGSLSIRTGNLEATSSTLTSASSSFAAQSASLSTRLTADETNITTLTNASASFAVVSSSFSSTSGSLSTRVTNLEATSSTVSSSFASTSGSIAGRVTTIESKYATTGSNTFTNIQYISSSTNAAGFTTSASLYTDGGARITKDLFVSGTTYLTNLTVYGTASVQYITSSQINVGANIIYLNTQTPAVRYGGMAVADSGSNAGVTGSMLWDSVNNGWIYTRESGSTYSGGALISGPRSSVQGSEQGTTNNALMKGQGGDHITSSQMIDDGTTVQIPGNLQVTGSIVGSSTATFSGNVGIGGSPVLKLDVQGNAADTGTISGVTVEQVTLFRPSNGVGGIRTGFNTTTGDAYLWSANSGASLNFGVRSAPNNTAYLSIASTGNVGIGTLTPGRLLEISDSTATTATLISFGINGGGKSILTGFISDGTNITNARIRTSASTPLSLGTTSSNDALWINNNGNIGIGTTTDSGYKLDVNGTGRFTYTGGVPALNVRASDANFALASIQGNQTGDVNWLLMSGYPVAGDFTIRQSDTVNALILKKTTGAATFSSSVTAGGEIGISGNASIALNSVSGVSSQQLQYRNNGTNKFQLYLDAATNSFNIFNSAQSSNNFIIASTGAATFSSSVLTNSEYDVNASGGIGGFTGFKLRYGSASVQSLTMGQATAGNGAWIGMAQYRAGGYWQTEGTAAAVLQFEGDGTFKINTNSGLTTNTDYNVTPRLTIANTGAATFSGNLLTKTSTDAVYDTNSSGTVTDYWSNQFSTTNGTAKTLLGAVGTTSAIVGYTGINTAGKHIITAGIYGNMVSTTAGAETGNLIFYTKPSNGAMSAYPRLTIDSTGAATFNSTVTATKGYFSSNGATDSTTAILANASTNDSTSYAAIFGSLNAGYRMVVRADGNVGIGTTSPGAKLHVGGTSYIGTMTGYAPAVHIRGAYYGGPRLQVYGLDADANGWMGLGTDMSSSPYELSVYYPTNGASSVCFGRYDGTATQYGGFTPTARLSYGGNWTVAGDVIAYGSPSDISLKTNIKPLEGALDKITKLQGVSFTWKEDTDASKMTGIKDDIGFIAQEVQEILPDLVRKNDNGLLSLRDKGITALLVEAIKEQQLQIEELKTLIHGLTK